ncbi:MAG: hypothetical protein ACFFAS_16295 [Promethearchaeota archaeon]
MSILKKYENCFKGENGFTRKILVILSIALIVQLLFLPTHFRFNTFGFTWNGFYGLHFHYEYNTGRFIWFFFPGDLFHTIPVIPAILIYLTLAIKLNKLARSVKLLLGISSSILFLLTLIIYPVMSYYMCFNCISDYYFTSILIILFYGTISLLLTFHISKKNVKPQINANETKLSRNIRIESSFVFIRGQFIVISILLVVQFFVPTYASASIYYLYPPELYYMYFFSGAYIDRIGIDTYSIGFDPLGLLQAIPVIVALILLIALIVKYQTLKGRIFLNMGITSSYLLLLSPILYFGIYFTTYGPVAPINILSCFNLHFITICSILILLGSIHISRKSQMEKGTTK